MAETPAPALIGAQRIVIDCEFTGVPASQRASLCAQIVKKARRHTNLPVKQATDADLKLGLNMRQQADQLLLRVKGEVNDIASGRKALTLQITPVRLARPLGDLAPVQSSASLVQVQGDWVLQGPVEGFEKLLGGGHGGKLRAPIHSDS